MLIPDVRMLVGYWQEFPPVHVSIATVVASFAKRDAPAKSAAAPVPTPEDLALLIQQFR